MDYRTKSQQGEPKNKMETMYTIRNSQLGLYLHVAMRSKARGGLVVEATMEPAAMASAFPRAEAEHIAAAWIAVAGDHAIEIEEA